MIKPTSNRLIVKVDAQARTAGESKIQLLDNAVTTEHTGLVVASGPGYVTTDGTLIPNSIKEGDVIFFTYPGMVVHIEGEKYNIIREPDVIGLCQS